MSHIDKYGFPKRSPSLTVTRSSGVCPSWFFRVGSAPCASNKAQSWVLPFWAASWSGVNAHLSVAFTHALYFISKAATSTCWKSKKNLLNSKCTKIIQNYYCYFSPIRVILNFLRMYLVMILKSIKTRCFLPHLWHTSRELSKICSLVKKGQSKTKC